MVELVPILKHMRRFLYTKEFLIFLVAILVRIGAFVCLWWWFRVTGHMHDPSYDFPVLGGDSSGYFNLSENLRHNGVFSLSPAAPFIPESFRLPGYPFFLYIFTFLPGSYVTAIIVQMILAAASPVILYKLGKKFLSEKGAFIGALLFCIEPTTVFLSTVVMSDTIFVFALLLGIYLLFLNPKNFRVAAILSAVAGLLFGYAVLVRVIAQYLADCIIAAYLFVYHQELRSFGKVAIKIGVFVVGMALVIAPWALREHRVFNTYTLSSTPYINFTQYNLVYFYAYQHHISTTEAQHVYSDRIPHPFASPEFQSLNNEAVFKQEMREGLEGNIIPYAKFHLIKTLPFFLNDSLRDINRVVGVFPMPAHTTNFTDLLIHKDIRGVVSYFKTASPDTYMLIVGGSVWALISILGFLYAAYAVLMQKKNVWFVLMALGIVIYFAILSSPVIQPRYRMPAAPFMLLLAAEAGVVLAQYLRLGAHRRP
jgi:4-amino-4-deoxy-L-arabinose transferase-like glycosyltransferase